MGRGEILSVKHKVDGEKLGGGCMQNRDTLMSAYTLIYMYV